MGYRDNGMIALHGLWAGGQLRLWGESSAGGSEETNPPPKDQNGPSIGQDSPDLRPHPFALSADTLRRVVGDSWDGLLAAGGSANSLELRLPTLADTPLASQDLASITPDQAKDADVALSSWRSPCLDFAPVDAIDLLTYLPHETADQPRVGQSLRFWARLARVLVDLLSAQRFAPDVITSDDGTHRAVWRPVLDELNQSEALAQLISSMPPVCRCLSDHLHSTEPRNLVENFFTATTDAVIRQSLADDPLASSLESENSYKSNQEIAWLRALVGLNTRITGRTEQCHELARTIREWVGQLDDATIHARFRTCFRLNTPEAPDYSDTAEDESEWTISIHLQACDDANFLLDAERVWSMADGVALLRGHYELLREQLEADLRRATHFLPALVEALERPTPREIRVDTDGAYTFLRECVSLLELNGFGVIVPEWCTTPGPQLGLRLSLSPISPGRSGSAEMGLDALVDYKWQVALGDEPLTADEFRQLCRRRGSLINFRGRWIQTRPEALKAVRQLLNQEKPEPITIFEALRLSMGRSSEMGLPVTGIDARDWLGAALAGIGSGNQTIVDLEQPSEFHGTLRPYQLKGLSWLSFLDRYGLGGCLADDMGLGKTIQLIALLLHERAAGAKPGPSLLVVPMSVVGNWQREIQRFSPSIKVMIHHGSERLSGDAFVSEVSKHDVVISTYALAHRDFDHLDQLRWRRIVLDEAQNIKNPNAKQTAATCKLKTMRRIAMTGTPLENHLTELWSINEFLNPGLLGTAADFRREFAVPIEKHHDAERGKQLRRLIQPFMLRRAKTDPGVADDLPPKMEMKVFCNLSREQAVLYQAVLDEMLGNIDGSSGMRRRGLVLAALTKLKQICNHPICVAEGQDDSGQLAGRSGKAERLVEMLEEMLAEGERALVFTQFRKMGDILSRFLEERLGYKPLYLHGGTTAPQRDKMIMRFQDDDPSVPIFLLSLRAGGFGLNLTSASHVFHFDRWWNPAVEDQASDRAHRMGQTKKVQIHKFVCVGTLEERIDKMLEEKRDLADRILGSGEKWLTELSTDQLREVLALSQEAVGEDFDA